MKKNKKGKERLWVFVLFVLGAVFFSFLGKISIVIVAIAISYYAFSLDFETASFVGIMSYIIPALILGVWDIMPKKKIKNKKPTRRSS